VGRVIYYLVQADIFRERTRGTIYSFEDEGEMLAWLAIFNQAVAAVVVEEEYSHMQVRGRRGGGAVVALLVGICCAFLVACTARHANARMQTFLACMHSTNKTNNHTNTNTNPIKQLHDYHSGLALRYIAPERQPAVLYVAHNAHYNLTTPIPTPARRNYVYSVLGLNAEEAAPFTEHKGSFDFLRGVVTYMLERQRGLGTVAVSPRYAEQMAAKLSVFWPIATGAAYGAPKRIVGILNALDTADSFASSGKSLDEVLEAKRAAKLELQRHFGLEVGEQFDVIVFIGRIAQQKGCDIIAAVSRVFVSCVCFGGGGCCRDFCSRTRLFLTSPPTRNPTKKTNNTPTSYRNQKKAAPFFMAACPTAQLLHLGPLGDPLGTQAQADLADLSARYPGRMLCPREGRYVSGAEKALIMAAADFCLIPSR
jgi:hypothetical protein